MRSTVIFILLSVITVFQVSAQRFSDECFIGAGKAEGLGIEKDNYYSYGCEKFVSEGLSFYASKGEINSNSKDATKINISINKYMYWNRYADVVLKAERQKNKIDLGPNVKTNIVSAGYRIQYNQWSLETDVQLRHRLGKSNKVGVKLMTGYKWKNGFGVGVKALVSSNENMALLSIHYAFN